MDKAPNTKSRFSVKVTMPAVFMTLTGVSMLIVILLNYYMTTTSVKRLADSIMTGISDHAMEKTLNHLGAASMLGELNRRIVDRKIFIPGYNEKLEEFAIMQLLSYPQISIIDFADESGNFWMVKRMPDKTISTKVIWRHGSSAECDARLKRAREEMPKDTGEQKKAIAELVAPCIETSWRRRDADGNVTGTDIEPDGAYDARVRPWYIGAKEKDGLFWTDVYLFASDQKPGITAGIPLRHGGEITGVTAVDIELAELSEFLKRLKIGVNGRAFIINSKGLTVALPDTDELKKITGVGEKAVLNRITDISDEAIAESFRAIYRSMGIPDSEPLVMKTQKLFTFTHAGERYFGLYKPFPNLYGWDWVIGIVVPENDFLAIVKRNILIGLGVSIASMLVVVGLCLIFSRMITRPLALLADETDKIREFELDHESDVRTPFEEIHNMAASFENMKTGLRSFGKFVPADIVRFMIRSGQEAELGGRDRLLTVYFSDIAGFTSISEKMEPHDLVVHLGEYLSEMSRIISEHDGTVDKYIGDAVMAFWNAPQDVADHAVKACRAALANQKRLAALREKWGDGELPQFQARIGINTGEVIVGNMGSDARLNYTVIGDAVNLASRLEGICKVYSVDIVISESTYRLAANNIVARRLDCVTVKGKTRGVFIYELLGEKGDVSDDVLKFTDSYEQAFQAYLEKRWDEAEALFRETIKVRGADAASELFVERCGFYRKNPPPDDWDGAFVMKTK